MLINAYSTLGPVLAPPPQAGSASVRGLDDPALAPHLGGFVNYVLGHGDGQMTAARYHLMRHVQRVRQHYLFELAEADLEALQPWLLQANAVCFLEDGSVRDPAGRVLLGEAPDPQAQVPYPADAGQRRARSQQQLQAHELRVPPSLPPVLGAAEAQLRAPAQVWARAQALLACALRAEALQSGEPPLSLAELAERLPALPEALSPAEAAFIAHGDAEAALPFGWRYESLAVLLWALGLSEALPWPQATCAVPDVVGALLQKADSGSEPATLRDTAELLDALDLHYRLHWVAREAQRQGAPMPGALEEGVIYERHYALNWLFCFEQADWDDVDTPT
ncbi:MAG: DUF4272 domain-containing protein [Stenotrophomonas maltophilia]|nr:DUF4272 domain-containing protein [Stenotrophomonas maltophilia]